MGLFKSVSQEISVKKQSSVISNPILYKNFVGDLSKADIIFLTDKPYSEKEVGMLVNVINSKKIDMNWSIVSSVMISPENLVSGVTDFYIRNRTHLESIIPENSKVISMGRAIYAITQSDDIREEDFIDYITNKNYFYSPDLKSYVFPIYEYFRWVGQDNFENRWVFRQVSSCKKFQNRKRRIKKHIYYDVDNTSQFFKDHQDSCLMAIDTETDSLNWRTNTIGYVSISFNSYEGYLLRWDNINIDEFSEFISNKKQIYTNGKFDCKTLITKGVKREHVHIDHDIWQMQHVWKEDNSHNSLKSGAWRHTHYGGYDRDLDRYKKLNKIKNYLDIPYHIMKPYATGDSIITFQVFEETKKLIEEMDRQFPMSNGWSTWRYYEEIVMGSVNMFLDVELQGLYINYTELKAMSKELDEEIKTIEDEVYASFGKEKDSFNIYSTDQLADVISELGWKIEEFGKNGKPLTNEACLTRWKKQGHKQAELLLKLREKTALMNTFVGREEDNSGYFQYLVKEGEHYKIYPTILPMVADSGRSKHRDPNTANIPAHGEGATFIRRMFCPPSEDYVFLSADAAGLQLRIAGILSKDPVLQDIFINQNGDMHSLTAAGVFGNIISYKKDGENIDVIKGSKEGYTNLGFEEFTTFRKFNDIVNDYRFKSKAVNFGAIFGAIAQTIKKQSIDPEWTIEACDEYIDLNNLKDQLNINEEYYRNKGYDSEDVNFHSKTLTVAEDVREKFFNTYKGLEKWIYITREEAKKNGFVRSIYGAFRRLPYLLHFGQDTDRSKYSNLLNICLNSPVQNIESVLMNRWLIHFNNWRKENNKKSYIFGAIHDAGEFMMHKNELQDNYIFLKEDFEQDYPEYDNIPLELEGNFSDYWGTYKQENWEFWDMGKAI